MTNYQGYTELNCYKKGRELRILVSQLVKALPLSEKYLLCDQLTRAARSVTTNIAEGYGRFTYKETKNFFIIARSSLLEIMEHITIAVDEGYLQNEQDPINNARALCELTCKLINGYIAYLNKSQLSK